MGIKVLTPDYPRPFRTEDEKAFIISGSRHPVH